MGRSQADHREKIDLSSSDEFADHLYAWDAATPGWTWARLEVWDVAGDGAFSQPVWNESHR